MGISLFDLPITGMADPRRALGPRFQDPVKPGLSGLPPMVSTAPAPTQPSMPLMPSINHIGITPTMPGVDMTPHGPPMPTIASPKTPSLWERVQRTLMPQSGIASLLDPSQNDDARKQGLMAFGLNMLANARGQGYGPAASLGQALAQSVDKGRETYQGAAHDAVNGVLEAQQIAQQQRILAARSAIGAKYAPAPNETPEQTASRQRAMVMDLLRAGDYEGVKAAGGLPGEFYKDPGLTALEHQKEPIRIDRGDVIELRDPANPTKVLETIKKGASPSNPETQAMREAALADRRDAQSARNEARLVQQYTQATKKYSQTADAIQAINENRAGALAGDPIAQQTLLQDFIKLNLPGQIVTQGELAHYANLMGLGDKGTLLVDKLMRGTPLSQAQIKSIIQHADNLVVMRRHAAKNLRDQYGKRAAAQNVSLDALPDWFDFLDSEETPTESAGGGSKVKAALGRTK